MFDFGHSGFTNQRLGKKLHIILTLIDMRERDGVSNEDRDALKHAIDYIKELEAEVGCQRPVRIKNNINLDGVYPHDITTMFIDHVNSGGA